MLFKIRRGWLAAAACLTVSAPLLVTLPADAQLAASVTGNSNGNVNGSGTGSGSSNTNRDGKAKVPLEGVLDHPSDRVAVTGQLDIETRIIQDTVFRNPDVLEMVIDFSGVRGVGQRRGAAFGTDAQVIVRRTLLPFDEFEVTFPYAPGNNPSSARTAVVSIAVSAANGGRVTFRQSKVTDFKGQ